MARSFNNLTGQVFGNWTVLSQTKTPTTRSKVSRWHCRCSCGNENQKVFYTALIRGQSTSCGMCGKPAHPTNPRMQNRIGEKHGRWTILSHLPKYKAVAQCDCGTIKQVTIGQLVAGYSQSCGCLRGEQVGARATKYHDLESHLLHDATNPLYAIWTSMKTRCYNQKHPAYQRYGARGITVDPLWKHDFLAFANHIGPRPSKDYSVDRIENNLGYCPGNVRWASRFTQAENRGNNPEVTYRGQTLRLRILAEHLNLAKSLLFHLYNTMPTLEEAIKVTREMMDGDITNAPKHVEGYTSFIDYTGQHRGEWEVLCYTGRLHRTAPAMWLCRDRDNGTAIVPATKLRNLQLYKTPLPKHNPPPPPETEDWI